MSSTLLDAHATDTQTLAPGESMTVSIRTLGGRDITTFVDDGAGGTPATYDLTANHRPVPDAAWMPYDTETETTAYSWIDPATAGRWQAEVTNQSGAEATYRVRLVSHGGGD